LLYRELFKEVFPSENQVGPDAKRQMQINYRKTFGTEHGKKVLNDLVLRARIFGPVDSPQQEGARRLVLDILTEITEHIEEESHVQDQTTYNE